MWHYPLEPSGGRLRGRGAFEHALAGRRLLDIEIKLAGVDGVARHVVVEEGVVEAVEIGAAIPGPAPAVAIGPADQVVHHFLAAGIDMIAHVDDEIGLRGIDRKSNRLKSSK